MAAFALTAGASPAQATHRDAGWKKFVRPPFTSTVKPARILPHNTTGNVHNPSGLITGQGPTKLIRGSPDEQVPGLIVDFGQDVVGLLVIEFEGSHNTTEGLPGLRLAFSETQEYLTNISDFTRSDNASGVSQKSKCTLLFIKEDGAHIGFREGIKAEHLIQCSQ